MDFVLIYGPPGVGKLSVAKKLARITGYKLFDSHATLAPASRIFDFGTREIATLADIYTIATVKMAIRHGIKGIIFTIAYSGIGDDGLVDTLIDIVERAGGKFMPVKLSCSRAELFRRVTGRGRKALGKISDRHTLASVLKSKSLYGAIPHKRSLDIDNTSMPPADAARRIKEHFCL
ncbi:MAG: AAA family ATPase [Candidatus Marsarchaeota archaeon]|jgi:broad-specificity NMP kinase|nr:AAA family ATPase [Candidatus Marsarchaeota archaeon]MCL5418595.1 AAA family ATPase [Candidatus Marsarchaeota archaeon]